MAETKNTLAPDFLQVIRQQLGKAFEQEANALFDSAKEKAIKELEAQRGEIVAGMMVQLSMQTDIQIMQDRLVVTVRKI